MRWTRWVRRGGVPGLLLVGALIGAGCAAPQISPPAPSATTASTSSATSPVEPTPSATADPARAAALAEISERLQSLQSDLDACAASGFERCAQVSADIVQAVNDLRAAVRPAQLSEASVMLSEEAVSVETFALAVTALCVPGSEANPSERCAAALRGLSSSVFLLVVVLAGTTF